MTRSQSWLLRTAADAFIRTVLTTYREKTGEKLSIPKRGYLK